VSIEDDIFANSSLILSGILPEMELFISHFPAQHTSLKYETEVSLSQGRKSVHEEVHHALLPRVEKPTVPNATIRARSMMD
jgi:hypothetical protein